MKKAYQIIIIIVAIVTYMFLGVTSTDEAKADVASHDATYNQLVEEVGENAASFLMNH